MENHKPFLVLLFFAFAIGFIAVVFVLRWVLHFREGLAWDGGAKEFNWHPLLTVTGFIFLQGIAIVVYRLPWTWKCSKLMMKFIHAGLHVLAFILAVIALVAVFDFHNVQNIPNMYSLHSWVGLTAVILFSLQIVLGLCIFLLPVSPDYLRSAFLPIHVFSGLFIFTTVIAAALMGITEKLIFSLNDPKYKDSPAEATFVNVLGLLIILFGSLILWIATRPSWKRPSEQLLHALHSNQPASVGATTDTAIGERPDPEPTSEARRRTGKSEE
ncbi:Cytochrome b reductase 1 [Bagarius yarrelli]|uniref:Plasma membrane ascorbate-dependent reductase CYBRD1 n=1 Tax=Bagarius yarrelli TaxID=175774 RepID=A0A556U4S2_BAGYA|nr:Cytochrome b reductase 1 [Bagarius yarrelli]